MEKKSTRHNRAFMQQVLTPEEFDSLRAKILEIKGFTHEGVRDSVDFPMWPAHEVLRRLPQDLMKRRRQRFINNRLEDSGLHWRANWLESQQTLQKGAFNSALLHEIAPVLRHNFSQFYFAFRIICYPLLSKELGVVKLTIQLGNSDGERDFYLKCDPCEGAMAAGYKDKERNKLYLEKVSALMSGYLENLSFPGCVVTDRVTSTGGDAEVFDFVKCWESALMMDWFEDSLSKAPVTCHSGLDCGVEWNYTSEMYEHWARLHEAVYPFVDRFEGGFDFGWYGFPDVEPSWLEIASLAARLTSKCGPIPVRLGDILVQPQGKSRGELYAIRVDEGMLLSVKGGGTKLLSALSEHFVVPWLQGVSPIPLPNKLDWTPIPPDPSVKPPVIFKSIPPFFKKATSKNGGGDDLSSKNFLRMLEQSGMFEGYDAEARKQAEEMIDASYRPEGDWQTQLISAIGFWNDADDASGYLEEVLAALSENSFGLFAPEELKIKFDDEEMPPEGDVRISYKLSGKSYRLKVECFYGSIPGELLPFIRESMEKSCKGVAWRPIFPDAKDGRRLPHTLCTAAALERIKANAAAMA